MTQEVKFEVWRKFKNRAPFSKPEDADGCGEDFEERFAFVVMEYDFQIVRVDVYVEWETTLNEDGEAGSYLKLKRGSKELKIGEYDEDNPKPGFQTIDTKIEATKTENNAFWQPGDKGERIWLHYHLGAEGCTTHIKVWRVSFTVKVLGETLENITFSNFPSGKLTGHGFPEDSGIEYKEVKGNFQLKRVKGRVKWISQGKGDNAVLKLKRGHFGAERVSGAELVLAQYDRKTAGVVQEKIFDHVFDRKNLFWKKGKKGEGLASYYHVGGANKKLEIQDLEIEAILEPATMGVESAARSLSGAASAAASATAPIVATGKVRAFVVGITAYVHLTELPCARRDAKAMAKLLKDAKADVTTAYDCNSIQLYERYHLFMGKVRPGDMVIIFFAGHGCQYKEQQRLFCRSFTTKERTDMGDKTPEQFIEDRSLALTQVVHALEKKKTKMNLILLDCCRTFAYKNNNRDPDEEKIDMEEKKSFNLDPGEGTCIGFATQPNNTAKEPTKPAAGSHGYYTQALLDNITTADVDVDVMLRRVGRAVEAATNGEQKPYRNSCINDERCCLFN